MKGRFQESQVFNLIEQIYDAAVDQSLWPHMMGTLMDATQSSAGVMYMLNRRTMEARILTHPGMESDNFEQYQQYYATVDPWNAGMLTRPVGTVNLSHEALTDSQLKKTEFFSDFLRPLDCFYAAGGFFALQGDWLCNIGIDRSKSQNPYDDEANLLQKLFPHLRRAMGIAEKLDGLSVSLEEDQAAMDHLAFGVMFLDSSLKVRHMNQRMTEIIRGQKHFMLVSDRLRAVNYQDNVELQALLSSAQSSEIHDKDKQPYTMTIEYPLGDNSLTLFARPFHRNMSLMQNVFEKASVSVFVISNEKQATPNKLLREIYGLSPMQSVVCEKLVSGLTLKETADILGIKIETAKSHLKIIFRKTGARRQSELLSMVAKTCSFLNHQ